MKLGVFGGTFDPIHFAHLFIAEEARVRIGLDSVLFVPNARPPHKHGVAAASAEDRYAMVSRAVADNPRFACSRIEIDRPGPSYTVDTLSALHAEKPGAELYFITGADTIPEIVTWHRWRDVAAQCRFVAAERPGYAADYAEMGLPQALLERVVPLGATHLDVSSTELRRRVAAGLPVRYLTPDAVAEYIAERGLYRASSA